MVIGQKKLIKTIDQLVENQFPRFCIVVGANGSGKKMISEYISKKLKLNFVICGTKVDEIRQIIQMAYTQKVPAMYVFPDTDNMSIIAKNALLKITEEPPTNAYIIMTLCDINKTLPTLISRGVLLTIEPYTKVNIKEFLKEYNYDLKEKETELLINICNTPGDINTLISYGLTDFYEYCIQVLENIAVVDGANAFKIAQKLAVKDDGWDIRLFLDTISVIALEALIDTKDKAYHEVIKLCSKYKSELSITGINKQFLIDEWIIQIRKVL